MKQTIGKGFTLIELLIVVAIIAILAAIAVPNFLEAQTRAKVSRAKADMRTFATAIEAYRVDNPKYPPFRIPSFHTAPCSGTFGASASLGASVVGAIDPGTGNAACAVSSRLLWITTPVSYITSILPEAFNVKGVSTNAAGGGPEAYDTYDFITSQAVATLGAGITSGAQWRLSSAGPDVIQAFGGTHVGTAPTGNTQLPAANSNDLGADYDSSNGTVSAGDIIRVGGGRGDIVPGREPYFYRVGNTFGPVNNNPPIN